MQSAGIIILPLMPPASVPTINAAMYRQASTAAAAPWVARELSAARATAARVPALAKNNGTAAKRISEPLPAVCGSVEPANGSPSRWNRPNAPRTVMPMSKHVPVELR